MEIFPDPALATVMTVPFVLTLVTLYFLLFRDLITFLDGREAGHEGALAEANALEAQVAERMANLNERLESARSDVAALRASERAAAQATEASILAEARQQADAKVGEALTQIERERKEAQGQIGTTAANLSSVIAAQVLGREVQA